jgi:predicted nucleotidyltransferase
MFQLLELFTKKVAMKILEFFIENPSGEFYGSEIREKIGVAKASSVKWLKKLVDYKLLLKRTKGRTILYKLNWDNVVVKQIKILINVAKIYDVLKGMEDDFEIYLYGSVAKGEDDKKSDVDLLIIGKIKKENLIRITENVKNVLRKEVRPLVLTPLEYAELSRKDKILYENIEKNKIRLL